MFFFLLSLLETRLLGMMKCGDDESFFVDIVGLFNFFVLHCVAATAAAFLC